MPSGKVHRRQSLFMIPYVVIVALFYNNIIIVSVSIIFSFMLMNPDNDMDGTKSDRSFWLWDKFWNPYSWLFSHRGMSHWHIIGTLTRISYLCLGITILIAIINRWVINVSPIHNLLYSDYFAYNENLSTLKNGIEFKINESGIWINYINIPRKVLSDIGIGLLYGDGLHIELDRAVSLEKSKAKAGIMKDIKKVFGLNSAKKR